MKLGGLLLCILAGHILPPIPALTPTTRDLEHCEALDDLFPSVPGPFGASITLRRVDLTGGNDIAACLNRAQAPDPLPCRTLQYALHESEDVSVGGRASNLRLVLSAGVYTAGNETAKISNSNNIAIVGAGISRTIIVCGRNGSDDVSCDYPNFQITNSSHVYVSGVTFTGCGPITSSFYIGVSDFVYIDSCSFEYVR